MISYLKGVILFKNKDSIILLVGGVGYQIFVGPHFLSSLKKGQEAVLFTYLKVREDDISLFGFPEKADLNFFWQLISISGVGPKSALHLLDSVGLQETRSAIIQKRADILTKAPGLGKKTAERIIVELRSKIIDEEDSDNFVEEVSPEDNDVARALEGLGYNKREINEALRMLPPQVEGVDNKIKEALKILGKK